MTGLSDIRRSQTWRAAGPPMQLSADPDYPWHDARWVRHVKIMLDDTPLRRVRTYDADAGWVEVYSWPARVVDAELATERKHGVVTIRSRGAA